MTMNEKWNLLVQRFSNIGDNPIGDLVSLIVKVDKNPTEDGYEKMVAKYEESEPAIKALPAKLYVETEKVIRSKMANIHDKISHELANVKDIRKKTKWELFAEEAKRKDWRPVLEVIDLIEKREKDELTEEAVEEIEKKINDIQPYINASLSPYESDWANKEFNKRKKMLANKVNRVVKDGFGDYIKELRKSKGYSLQDLENRTQISASYINRLENGSRKTPSIPIAEKLAIGLGVPVQEFLAKLKAFEGDNGMTKEVIVGLPELIAINSFTINGKQVTKRQKETLINLINGILSASWTSETILNDQYEIIQLVDAFKKQSRV